MKYIQKINKCINELKNMTQKEFDKIIKEKHINDKKYNYNDNDFEIIINNK